MQNTTTLHDGLRAWAEGTTPIAAATELLIRTGFATPGAPWISSTGTDSPWIRFAEIPDLIGALAGSEQRVLRIAASLGADVPIILGDEISGLDRKHTALVVTALTAAAGFAEPTRSIVTVDGVPTLGWAEPILAWSAE